MNWIFWATLPFLKKTHKIGPKLFILNYFLEFKQSLLKLNNFLFSVSVFFHPYFGLLTLLVV